MHPSTPDDLLNRHCGDDDALAVVIDQVLRRRAAGEALPDERVAAEHPELMPGLLELLQSAAAVRAGTSAGQRAGPIGRPFEILPPDALDAPLDADETQDADEPRPDRAPGGRPQIVGYRIVAPLASGGQASVFKAVQEATGRLVAIKVLFGGPFLSSRHRARFAAEVAAMAKLDHPHIVGVLDRGSTRDGSSFLTMNFVDGVPLDRYVRGAGLTTRQFIALSEKVARAVDYAHLAGIIHRDLKPSNVLVDGRGEPHVMDFGLAKLDGRAAAELYHQSAHTLTGQILGSLPWASPEAAAGRGASADARSDVYSLGVMLFQSLTGEWPYKVVGPITEVVANIRSQLPSRALRLRGTWRVTGPSDRQTDVGLDTVIDRALAKEPAARQQTAGGLADELRALLEGRPVARRSQSGVSRRWILLSAGVGCIAVSAGLTLRHKRTASSLPPVLITKRVRNDLGMSFVPIPAGRFRMGSEVTEDGHDRNEQVRLVEITQPFLLGETAVTRAQYASVMGQPPDGKTDEPGDLPVDQVTWLEAVEFCDRLGRKDGNRYRLPTEAEWEYACRAGTMGAFNAPVDEAAWYAGNSGGRLHPVDQKAANAFGLHDMHGGVAEWCEDWYEPRYTTSSNGTAVNPRGPDQSFMRVIRGGSAFDPAIRCRSAARRPCDPEKRIAGAGFRVVMEQ